MDDVTEEGGGAAAPGDFSPTARTTLRRLPKRGSFERETVNAILDEGFVCHVGFVSEGQPFVIPTAYGRVGDTLYLHGAKASRMLRALAAGGEVCVTVTLLDGLVLARSAFHHSINYRSVGVFARPLGRSALADRAGVGRDRRRRAPARGGVGEGQDRAAR